jgi:hypothetical protein
MNTNKNHLVPKQNPRRTPSLIAVHSFNGKPMKEEGLKKFIDGALSIADNAADSLHHEGSIIVEEEWSQ